MPITSRRFLLTKFRECCRTRIADMRANIANVVALEVGSGNKSHPRVKLYYRHQLKMCIYAHNLDIANALKYFAKSEEDRHVMLEVGTAEKDNETIFIGSINGHFVERVDGNSNCAMRSARILQQNHLSDESLMHNMRVCKMLSITHKMDEPLEVEKMPDEIYDPDLTDA